MKRWKQWTRLGVIGVASFVLLVTVLPQVASGIGLGPLAQRLATPPPCASGTLGVGSSSRCLPVGTVTGKVTLTGKPAGFVPAYLGAGACPDTGPAGMACANPIYAFASKGIYSLSLTTGKWRVDGFYEVKAFGGVFLGTSQVVTVKARAKVTKNFTVAYVKPAALKGTITVTGVPAGIPVEQLSVLLCPSFAPYNGKSASIACVNGYDNQFSQSSTGPYAITGLPPGKWTAYPSFCLEFGCFTNAQAGKAVTLVAGRTKTTDLTTPILTPGNGLVSGKVTVTGAPAGFSDPTAISACGKEDGFNFCQEAEVTDRGMFALVLGSGTWKLSALYLVPPFYNAISGPTTTVKVTSGHRITVNIADPYRVLGTAQGTIDVLGAPAGVVFKSYTMLACPAGGGKNSLQCISEFSGPAGNGFEVATSGSLSKIAHPAAARPSLAGPSFNAYRLPTLTPGTWVLYPGYQTVFGSVTDPTGTKVTVGAGKTTTLNVAIPYQFPTVGAVVGTVDVIGGSEGDYQAGAEACSAPPTSGTCNNQQSGYGDPNGAFTLTLSPGTWWVAGFVDTFGVGPGTSQKLSPAHKIVVRAGVVTTENLVVLAS